ncbi:MAG: HD-GYP domain-containing protein [Pseudothermotoga sp.]
MKQNDILIVSGRDLLTLSLEMHGKDCLQTTSDCFEAYKLCRADRRLSFCVVDCDWFGIEALSLIRAIRENLSFVYPCILAVASSSQDARLALIVGADAVFQDLSVVRDLVPSATERKDELFNLNAFVDFVKQLIENSDSSVFQHCKNTAIISMALAAISLQDSNNPAFIRALKAAALFHDLGKIFVPRDILQKPSRLTAKEFEVMKTHTTTGAHLFYQALKFASDNDVLLACAQVCLYHHEKYDGSGYPQGLVAQQIPLPARIVAIADVFDALSSERCYRQAYKPEDALQIMKEQESGHFDPQLLSVFLDSAEIFLEMKRFRECKQ